MKNCTKSMMDGTQKETGFVHRAISFLLMQAQYAVPSLRALMTALLLIMGSAAFATIEIAGTLGPCGNDMGGMIAVTASGNAGPFTIRLIDGVSDPVEMVIDGVNETIAYFEGLSFGDYTVEVENAYMCVTTLETEVPNNGEQILQDMGTDVSCKCPDGYGFITANISGNITLYEWTGPNQFTYSSALPLLDLLYETGSYNLTVTDANGCQNSFSYTLYDCILEDIYTATVNHSCDGPETGSINVTLSPEQSPLGYLWTYAAPGESPVAYNNVANNGQQSTANNLTEGEYCLTFFTSNGCSVYECWEIQESEPIEEISGVVNPAVGGIRLYGSDGNVLDGSLYDIIWTDYNDNLVGTTPSIGPGLEPNIYTATVTLANSGGECSEILEFSLYSCQQLEGFANLCPTSNECPLSAEIFVQGYQKTIDLTIAGLDDYMFEYVWELDGNPTNYNTQDITVVQAGKYCVTAIERFCGSEFTQCFDVCDFDVKIKSNIAQTDICSGIEVTAHTFGSSASFSYEWNDDAGSTSSSILMEYNREYCVTITDESGCSMSACRTNSRDELMVSYTTTDATFGSSNGSISLTTTGGFPDYSYQWEDTSLSGSSVTGLSGGDYVVTVTDDCDNEVVLTIHVDCVVPQQIVVDCVEAGITPVDCGNSLGSIAINEECINMGVNLPTGTNPEYKYHWSNGETTSSIVDLPVGEYCVTILEKNSECSVFACFDVPQADENPFTLTITPTQTTCYGGTMGALSVSVDGVTNLDGYTYEWSHAELSFDEILTNPGEFVPIGNEQEVTDVGVGWYSVTVNSPEGCSVSEYYFFFVPPSEGFAFTVEETTSFNCDDLSTTITTEIVGGNPGATYSYEWSTGTPLEVVSSATGPDYTTNTPGGHYLQVTDNETGCLAFASFGVQSIKNILIQADVANNCNGSGGQIDLMLSGGVAPYNIIWDNGETAATIDDLEAGEYCVTVTDAIGCSEEECFVLSNISSNYQLNSVDIIDDCESQCAGSIIAYFNTNVFECEWSGGIPSQISGNVHQVSNLCAGEYTLTATSSQGCVIEETFTVGGVQDFDYEVQINWFFDANSSGTANITIRSSDFTSGGTVVLELGGTNSDITENVVFDATGPHVDFIIPSQFNTDNPNMFDFTYINPSNCEYSGDFTVNSCNPHEGFEFDYEHVSGQQNCVLGDEHSYIINISGPNPPYFVEITMAEPTYSENEDYEQIVEYTGSDFYVNGIPPGLVNFEVSDYCGNHYGNGQVQHLNCCEGAVCDGPNWDVQTDDSGGSHKYRFNYFYIDARSLCFDNGSRTEVHDLEKVPADRFCWAGTITFEYPDGTSYQLHVTEEDGSDYDIITEGEGNYKFHPSTEGTYTIQIVYTGTGDYLGQNCTYDFETTWYGNDGFEVIANATQPSSPTAMNGAIELVLEGITDIDEYFTYEWSGPAGYTATGLSNNGLSAGDYYITVKNGCEYEEDVYVCLDYCGDNAVTLTSNCAIAGQTFTLTAEVEGFACTNLVYNFYNAQNQITTTQYSNVFTAGLEGYYSVTVSDESGSCSATDGENAYYSYQYTTWHETPFGTNPQEVEALDYFLNFLSNSLEYNFSPTPYVNSVDEYAFCDVSTPDDDQFIFNAPLVCGENAGSTVWGDCNGYFQGEEHILIKGCTIPGCIPENVTQTIFANDLSFNTTADYVTHKDVPNGPGACEGTRYFLFWGAEAGKPFIFNHPIEDIPGCNTGGNPCESVECAWFQECYQGECYDPNEVCNFSRTIDGGGAAVYTLLHNLDIGTILEFSHDFYTIPDLVTISGGIEFTTGACLYEDGTHEVEIVSNAPIKIAVSPCEIPSDYHIALSCPPAGPSLIQFNNESDISNVLEFLDLKVYPNPFQDAFEIEVNSPDDGKVKVEIFNLLGNNFLKENTEVVKGRNKFNYDLDLPVGVYQVIVTDEEGNTSTQRIIRTNN